MRGKDELSGGELRVAGCGQKNLEIVVRFICRISIVELVKLKYCKKQS